MCDIRRARMITVIIKKIKKKRKITNCGYIMGGQLM